MARAARLVAQPIEGRPPREKRPKSEAVAQRRRRKAALEFALAPVTHHLGQGNAHRANRFASPAKRRRVRELTAFRDADERRRQHRAHRAGINPAIGVPADRLIDRAMVHAGAAADATQHILEFAAEHRRSAVVEEDDVIFGRTIRIVRSTRPGREGRVDRGVLARRRAREDAKQLRRVLHVGTIFSSDAITICALGRICVRSPLPSLVTMTDAPVSATRKFAPVMPTSAERNLARRMPRASASSGSGAERSRFGGRSRWALRKSCSMSCLRHVNRRRNDVGGGLAAKLDDVFAEIGLDRAPSPPLPRPD